MRILSELFGGKSARWPSALTPAWAWRRVLRGAEEVGASGRGEELTDGFACCCFIKSSWWKNSDSARSVCGGCMRWAAAADQYAHVKRSALSGGET